MCDFDSFLAVTVTKFIQPRVKIIYDEFDPITTRPIPIMLVHVINIVQKFFFVIVDNFIFPSAERIHTKKLESRSFVVNNMPDEHLIVHDQQMNRNSIFYGGLLSAERGLETFLKVISNQDIWTITVAGYGPLEDYIKLLADSHPEVISYVGAIRHNLLMEYSAKSSLILASYDPEIGNSLQLASNKYYEAILLKRPILACNGTAIGEKVANEKIGWTFDFNDEENISKVLEQIHQQNSELWPAFSANLSKLESEIEMGSSRRMLPSIINNLLEV
jgi:glycosyltransferase involved in cell wall biosynthesis